MARRVRPVAGAERYRLAVAQGRLLVISLSREDDADWGRTQPPDASNPPGAAQQGAAEHARLQQLTGYEAPVNWPDALLLLLVLRGIGRRQIDPRPAQIYTFGPAGAISPRLPARCDEIASTAGCAYQNFPSLRQNRRTSAWLRKRLEPRPVHPASQRSAREIRPAPPD